VRPFNVNNKWSNQLKLTPSDLSSMSFGAATIVVVVVVVIVVVVVVAVAFWEISV